MTRLHTFRGRRYTTIELAELSGVSAFVIRNRLKEGWTLEQALCIPTIQQRRAGVVSNLDAILGTGAGSTAQEIPEITFSDSEVSQ